MKKRNIFFVIAATVIILSTFAILIAVELNASTVKIYPFGSVTVKSDGQKYLLPKTDVISPISEISNIDPLPTVEDREQLLKILLDMGALYDPNERGAFDYSDGYIVEEAMPDMSTGSSADSAPQGSNAAGGGPAFSTTNEQVAGVNEGDVVKTDGTYIYYMLAQNNCIKIVKADGTALDMISTITFDDISRGEFYLIGDDRLLVVGTSYSYIDIMPLNDSNYIRGGNLTRNMTAAVIYDISDKSNPTELRRVLMDGHTVSTRVVGSTLYMVTNKYIGYIAYDSADSASILPFCRDSEASDSLNPIDYRNIYVVPDTNRANYLLVGALDISKNEPFTPQAYLGAGDTLYMSKDAIYIANTRYEYNPRSPQTGGDLDDSGWIAASNVTDILRLAVSGTKITYTGKGTVGGFPINQYSMDEYNGFFRIATTHWGIGTFVTILKTDDMKIVGQTEALEPNEQMRSMRFMGDLGYVVTFENTDPLFTIDLSNPYRPTVLGELKIPGFSQYLHPVGNGLLMGIGRDTEEIFTRNADGTETVIGFRDVGLKVSLFDVSNPYDPKEVDILQLGEGWSEISENPRALMADMSRGKYGFVFTSYDYSNLDSWHAKTMAVVLTVEYGKLNRPRTPFPAFDSFDSYAYGSRLCYIGNILYLIDSSGIAVYDYTTFEKLNGGLKF